MITISLTISSYANRAPGNWWIDAGLKVAQDHGWRVRSGFTRLFGVTLGFQIFKRMRMST